jgi:hypothetical protein
MAMSKELNEYLNSIKDFLSVDIDDKDQLIRKIAQTEPEKRVVYDDASDSFRLGMAVWPVIQLQDSLKEIREVVISALTSVNFHGKIEPDALEKLNSMSHDLKIQHFPSPDTPSGMKLGYVVPDSKIAWEEGKCPHCGETVTMHLFPDPIPLLAYEAIINTLRLLTRNAKIEKVSDNDFQLGDSE